MTQHPLEPLSADEFRQTASILRREGLVRDTFRFASIELKEPPKGEVKAWRPGDAVRRTSFAVVFNREDNKTYEATVDLTGHAVVFFGTSPTSHRTSPSTNSTMSTSRCASTPT